MSSSADTTTTGVVAVIAKYARSVVRSVSTSFCSSFASTSSGVTAHPPCGHALCPKNSCILSSGQAPGVWHPANGGAEQFTLPGDPRLRNVCVRGCCGSHSSAFASSTRTSTETPFPPSVTAILRGNSASKSGASSCARRELESPANQPPYRRMRASGRAGKRDGGIAPRMRVTTWTSPRPRSSGSKLS